MRMARCAFAWEPTLTIAKDSFSLHQVTLTCQKLDDVSLLKTACDVCAWQQVVLVDVRELGRKSGNLHRKLVVERALRTKDQDNERFYESLRARMERCTCRPRAVLLAKHLSRALSRLGVTLHDSQHQLDGAVSGNKRLNCTDLGITMQGGH